MKKMSNEKIIKNLKKIRNRKSKTPILYWIKTEKKAKKGLNEINERSSHHSSTSL